MSIKKLAICLVVCLIILCGCICYLVYEMNCTHGIYEINISAVCLSNNSVGSEWHKSYTMDGEIISSGEQITAPLDKTIQKTIKATITEIDKWSDTASKDIAFTLRNNESTTSTIIVTENKGRFMGNTSKWEITVNVKLIKKQYDIIDRCNY